MKKYILCISLLAAYVFFFYQPAQAYATACNPRAGGNLTVGADCSFAGTINGVDNGAQTDNTATLTINSGILTISPYQQIAFGTLVLNGGAIALPIDGTASLLPNTPLWMLDEDDDHYPATDVQIISSTAPGNSAKRRVTMANTTTSDCYDLNPSVFPGQTGFFTVDRGDGSYDYDCDGQITKSTDVCTCSCSNSCATSAVCVQTIVGSAALCGETNLDAGPSSCARSDDMYGNCDSCASNGTTYSTMKCR